MKTSLFLILAVLFVLTLFLPNGFAQYVFSDSSTLEGHWGNAYSVAFSPDGSTLASGSDDNTIRLWNAVTGEHKATLEGHWGNAYSVAFSPDGSTLASGSDDNTIRLWYAVTGERKATLEGHWDYVRSVAFSPDGSTLASGSDDNTIRLWNAVTGEHKATLEGHWGNAYSVAFSPDGSTLASGSDDNTIRLWNAVTGEHKATLEGHWGNAYSVAFSPDGSTLASGSSDNTIRLWELPSTLVSITPNPVESPTIGGQFSINVSIVEGKNVGGYQVTVTFDATALRYVESANGDYLPDGAFFVPPVVSENKVTLGATSLAGVSNGEGTLAAITFEVVDVKRSDLILSQALLTDSDGKYLSHFIESGGVIEPAATPSPAVISVTPSSVLSPAIRQQLVFNVNIDGGHQDVAGYRLYWEFDNTALEYISGSQGDYLADGIGNGDGTLFTAETFVVRAVKTSTVSLSGHLIRSNGFRYIPTFESAAVIAPLFGDVNRDGVVNILDLVLVGSSFGQHVGAEGNPADVNESEGVTIVDLVLVAGAINDVAAAPSSQKQKLAMLTAAEVQGWLTQARRLNLTDATSQRGIVVLEQLLAALTPKETTLLPNYPNPFNPETWIPYDLSKAADVQITIYDTEGRLVRRLDLGHQPAGYYTNRAKAAYWDGKNESGEQVASGVYFYRLYAGDYSATRKMLILK